MFSRLLVPVEFGMLAEASMRAALRLASKDAELRVLHVVPGPLADQFCDTRALDHFIKEAEERMLTLEHALGEELAEIRISTAVRVGNIVHEIREELHEMPGAVLVLGSHGRKGLPRWLLGSVAHDLMHKAAQPVCIIKKPEGIARPGSGPLRRIALATDFAQDSAAAMQLFEDFLQETSAAGVLLHALGVDALLEASRTPQYLGAIPNDLDEQIERSIAQRKGERKLELEAVADGLRAKGLSIETVVLEGDARHAIAAFCDEQAAAENELDLLIMGSHGFGALRRALLGSVAEGVLRSTESGVLIVPSC